MEEQRIVGVRLEDLCRIADAVATMKGNLHNGKWKYLEFEIDSIHEITERWAADEAVLGGGCHDDHRCGPCQSLPTPFHARFVGPGMSAESLGNRDSLTDMAETPEFSMRSDPVSGEQAHRVPEAEASDAPATRMPAEMLRRRYFDNGDAEFLLFPVSDFVVQVMYRDQTGYFGVVAGWDISEAYTHTRYRRHVSPDGIEGFTIDRYQTPDAALIELCSSMLDNEHNQVSERLTFEELKDAAGEVLGELLNELTA